MLGRYSSLAGIAFACIAAPLMPADGPKLSGHEAEADGLIDTVWSAALTHCGGSAFEVLDNRVVIELDSPQFHLAPTELTEVAKTNGYEHQVTAIASARRWRWGRLVDGWVSEWQAWREGQDMIVRYDQFGGNRGHTLVEDAVLQFDLVRRKGEWSANVPLSPLNSAIRSFDFAAGEGAQSLSCDALTRSD